MEDERFRETETQRKTETNGQRDKDGETQKGRKTQRKQHGGQWTDAEVDRALEAERMNDRTWNTRTAPWREGERAAEAGKGEAGKGEAGSGRREGGKEEVAGAGRGGIQLPSGPHSGPPPALHPLPARHTAAELDEAC